MRKLKYLFLSQGEKIVFCADYVDFHMDLLSDEDKKTFHVNGGGEFCFDLKNKEILLFGRSCDYGKPKDIEKCIKETYSQIIHDLEEVYFNVTEFDIDLSDYKIAYLDDYDEKHIVSNDLKS